MAFASLIKGLVSNAMTTVGDLAPVVTYRQVIGADYDPETGTMVENTKDYSVKGVLASFSLSEKDANVVVTTDQKLLVAAADLPVRPAQNDRVIISGKFWNVMRLLGVPGESLYIIHIREV